MRAQDFLDGALKDLKFRVSFPGEVVTTQENIDILAMRFHLWMLENDTEENAERFFHYQLTDMLNEFKKEKGL